jgi:hypothetical protein
MRICPVAAGIAVTLAWLGVWPCVAMGQTRAGAAEATVAVPPAAPPSAPAPVSVPAATAVAPPPSAPEAPPTPASPSEAAVRADLMALHEEVASLRAQVEKTRTAPRSEGFSVGTGAPSGLGSAAFWPWVLPPDGISVSGYLQSQYEAHQDSQNQLAQGGALLNKDRFSIRRARVSLTGDWEYVALALQLDTNTTNGPQVDLRKAEASLQYRPDRSKPPILMATLGLFDTPFGYELVEPPHLRWFMERSVASQAFWPGEPDLGLRIAGALGFFRWTISGLNGNPIGTTYALQDPISAKDVVFRFGFDTMVSEDFHLAGGVSSLRGTGFYAGTDATGSTLQWTDVNGDGAVQPIEIIGVTGQAATASKVFDRWAVGADLRAHYRSSLGVTTVSGEFVLASNMDRGLFVANPVATGTDQREFGLCVSATQEITPYGVVGLRFDYYDPNFDATDSRGGGLIPVSEAIKTVSPLVGLVLPERARLLFQYDAIQNALGRTIAGVPTNLKDNVWTLRLQVQL